MAFKLVGDQVDGIKKAQKRRIRELLLDGIPEKEVIVMRNGRFACLVCGHRPVFDSLEILSIHRNGKKHLQAATRKVHILEISTSKAIMNQCSEPPMLAKTKQVKIDCLAVSKPTSGVSSDIEDGNCSTSTKRRCFDHSILEEMAKDNNSNNETLEQEELKQLQYVFPWKHKVNATPKRRNSKQILPEKPVEKKTDVSLRSSGWIPNGDGTWSKEEGVEFDSDEDSPP